MHILEYVESKFQITLTMRNIKSTIDIIGRRKNKINDCANSFTAIRDTLDKINQNSDLKFQGLSASKDLNEGRIIIFSDSTIKKSAQATTLQIDCTHKLLFNRFPVIVIGVNDFNQKFYPIGIGLLKRERAEDYQWALKQIFLKLEFEQLNNNNNDHNDHNDNLMSHPATWHGNPTYRVAE